MVQIEPHFSYVRSTRGHLKGNITVPGSKSCTIRAVMLGMLADGITTIHNPLASRDGISALRAAKLLGATVSADQENHIWTIQGLSGVPKVPDDVIDTLNSGTTTSFTTGICTLLTNGYAVITGDEQIRNRPWRHETDALKELGATCIHTRGKNDSPPLVISGPIHGGKCHLPGFNSQHVSGVLVPAALLPEGESIHIEVADPLETPYVQMTIDWMKKFGAEVDVSADYKHYYIKGGQSYHACNCTIPSDWSSVAFPLVAAVCTPSEVVISGVKFDDVQGDKIVVDLLLEMGADIEKDKSLTILSESEDAGVYMVMARCGREFFITGHSEYSALTLDIEYRRDLAKGLDIALPRNYYPDNNPDNNPIVNWRGHANLLFTNWLNYFVYQQTPYNLNDIQ